jgi:membrane-bound lytic murein transglycosylase C
MMKDSVWVGAKCMFFSVVVAMIVLGCTRGEMVRATKAAASGDVEAAERLAAEKAVRYAANPKALEQDVKRFKREFSDLVQAFLEAVISVWGSDEVKEPKPKEYVKYTQNYLSRASVDFDKGLITVETLDQKEPLTSLKNAVVTTLLTPDDPRAVDLFSAKSVKLGEMPFLYQEVKDQEGKDIRWSWRAERFADHLIENRLQSRQVKVKEERKTVRYVRITMVKDHHEIRARKYRPLVAQFAARFSISRNLVYAITKTESDFNPYAVSEAPAFGLMQIVPTTAGRDVYRFLNKKDGTPSGSYLFVPKNNIKYGTAYLHLLHDKYLDRIENRVSREYCVITAYNAGAGNVLRTFDSDKSRAVTRINKLSPLEVYKALRTKTPSHEARRYLAKVMEAKKEFVNF